MSEEQRLNNLGIDSELPPLERERKLREKLRELKEQMVEGVPPLPQAQAEETEKQKY